MNPIRLLELHPADLKAIVDYKPLIIVPIGTVEWHADHLPLGVDSLICQAVCEDISSRTGCVVAPLFAYGISRNLNPDKGYYGTLDTIAESSLTGMVADMLKGFARLGFKKAVLMSGHYEPQHFNAISAGIKKVKKIKGYFMMPPQFCEDRIQESGDVTLTWPYASDHAAEWETSMMLHYYPKLVNMDKAPETIDLPMPGIPAYIRQRYPRRASRAYGRKLAKAIIPGGVNAINKLLEK
jgi:creatinine amidohydrolase